ncbi:hypothetical protein CNR22_11530 [Sphingobacteriaceae bacterium]|nr:hypothetical protein CNR22_11530 [Sphingobacteriaceae bacterium]
MSFLSSSLFYSVLLFAGILLMDTLGCRLRAKKNTLEQNALGAMEGALLGLLGLLLAFTFNLSAIRYDTRRQAIVEEANAIGTAILRTDLYADSLKPFFKKEFANYVNARIAYYNAGNDESKIHEALGLSSSISQGIWNKVALLSHDKENFLSSSQMIPALNSVIDWVSTRDEARLAHVPHSIIYLLFVLCLSSGFIIGYGRANQKSNWILVFCFSLMISITVYLILDLDQPRSGLITMDATHLKMKDLLLMLK